MTPEQILQTIDALNNNLPEELIENGFGFEYRNNTNTQAVFFNNEHIWNDQDDMREWNVPCKNHLGEEDFDRESLETFIKRWSRERILLSKKLAIAIKDC